MTIITIERLKGNQWHATFDGGDMPQGVPMPLPFTPLASSATVARDMQARFPGATVRYEGETYRPRVAVKPWMWRGTLNGV
jgi:hypothetical protein